MEPDHVRGWAYGDGYTGYTEPGKVAPFLSMWGIPYRIEANVSPRLAVEVAIAQGWPVMARSFEPQGFFHYCPVIGFTADTITRHIPLGGYAETLSWRDWLYRYAGWLLVVEEGR